MNPRLKPLIYLLGGALLIVILRTAWYGDDAYITFRTVDNVRHGFGLTWNTDERVQAYTHPLWMLVSTAAASLTNEYYLTLIVVQVVLSIWAVAWLIRRGMRQSAGRLLFLLALIMSASFIEYATSGLENALSYLLLTWFAIVFLRSKPGRSLGLLTLISSLVVLNRYDLLLIVAPAWLYTVWQGWRQTRRPGRQVLIGASPLIAWLIFSLIYYGTPLPNTAYAKLNTGIPGLVLIKQGLLYLLNSISQDPITLVIIGLALALGWINRHQRPLESLLSLGILLYLLYLVKIGGDYMSGRFLAAPFLLSAFLAARQLPEDDQPLWPAYATGLILLGLIAPHPIVLSNRDYGQGDPKQAMDGAFVINERFFYYGQSGLLTYQVGQPPIRSTFYDQGLTYKKGSERVVEFPTIGFAGFAAGPHVHIVDHYALSEPLLARLPIIKSDLAPSGWRIGHFVREIPCGYLETLKSGQNQICDRDLAEYYDHLKIVTSGPLFSWTRIKNIVGFSIGRYDHLLQSYLDRNRDRYDFDKSI